jgi:hypothetical protein
MGTSGCRALTASISRTIAGHSWVNTTVMPTSRVSAGMRSTISSGRRPTR